MLRSVILRQVKKSSAAWIFFMCATSKRTSEHSATREQTRDLYRKLMGYALADACFIRAFQKRRRVIYCSFDAAEEDAISTVERPRFCLGEREGARRRATGALPPAPSRLWLRWWMSVQQKSVRLPAWQSYHK